MERPDLTALRALCQRFVQRYDPAGTARYIRSHCPDEAAGLLEAGSSFSASEEAAAADHEAAAEELSGRSRSRTTVYQVWVAQSST